jgi:hypothetical protein
MKLCVVLRTEVVTMTGGASLLSGSGKVLVLRPGTRAGTHVSPARESRTGTGGGHGGV